MSFISHVNDTYLGPHQVYRQLEDAQSLPHPYRGAMEVVMMLPLYSLYMSQTLSYIKGFPKSRKAAAIGFPPRVVIVHVFACLAVVSRYYSRLLVGQPTPDRLDLTLAMLQLATAWYLAKWTPSKSNLYKSSFLTMPLLMIFPVGMAYATGSPGWYRTAVKCVEWFLHFRLVIHAVRKYKMFEPQQIPQDMTYHLVSVPVTLALADWTAAIPLYFVVLPLVILLNEWVTKQAPHNEATRSGLVEVLVTVGFGQRQTKRPPADTNKEQ